jgi:hypothetical protein
MRPYLHPIVLLEVMDKEWSLPIVWLLFLTLGIIGFVLGRRTWWACIPAIAGITLLAVGQLSEMHDSVVGPDILSEAGHSYFVQSYAAIVISFVFGIRRDDHRADPQERTNGLTGAWSRRGKQGRLSI